MCSTDHHDSLDSIVKRYLGIFPLENERLKSLVFQLSERPRLLLHRQTFPGHITASGIVVKGNEMLMIFHPYLRKWLAPGGHIDEMESPEEAAIRETREETGFLTTTHSWHGKHNCPFDIDTHQIPENPEKNEPAHLHYDFRYLLDLQPATRGKTENLAVEWRPWRDLDEAPLLQVKKKLRQPFLLDDG
jgi:8-oxo-dGTP pyrophosphatase MutT (NUDIX family)